MIDRRTFLQSVAAAFTVGAARIPADADTRDSQNKAELPGASLNHVMIRVPDFEQAKSFYAEKFGFREVLSFNAVGRKPAFAYLQISRNTFLELQPASGEHPPGLGHIGLELGNLEDAVKILRQSGLTAQDIRVSHQTGAHISSVQATPGVTFELLEFPPDSLVRKAMNSWNT
ncbi:MAG TPA: VOC family protein [Candidatus Acidoferrales bacterium]|nr:VOC family protein [Candidatus Acidoferrales bacterium]